MEINSKFLLWGIKMAKEIFKKSKRSLPSIPIVLLMPSEKNDLVGRKIHDEIKVLLTQIILMGDKKGRPKKDQLEGVEDAA